MSMPTKQQPQVGKELRASFLPLLRSVDEKARTIEFVASTEAVDRYGDVIRVAGWKYTNYLKNPVFLWAHRSGDPPVGRCIDLKIETNPPALVQTIEFADAATYPFAETIFRLYKGGFMRAVSVGFMPLEPPKMIVDEESGRSTGCEFTSQELLELSAVPIPANAEALARAVSSGFSPAEMKRVFSKEDERIFLSASQTKIVDRILAMENSPAAKDPEYLSILNDLSRLLRDVQILKSRQVLSDTLAVLRVVSKSFGQLAKTKKTETVSTGEELPVKPAEETEITSLDGLCDALTGKKNTLSEDALVDLFVVQEDAKFSKFIGEGV